LPCPDALVTADDVAQGKPDPEGYRKAAERLGVPTAATVVVEDMPVGYKRGPGRRRRRCRRVGQRSRMCP